MSRNMWLGIGAVVVVAAFIGVAAGVAFAQAPTPPNTTPGYGPGWMGGGGMMSGGMGMGMGMQNMRGMMGDLAPGWMHEAMLDAFAEALDLDRATLEERLAAGETMRAIADGAGLTQDEFFAVMAEARAAAFAQAVDDGRLTQTQADAMAARMAQMHAGMGSGMMGAGMMGNGGYGPGACPYANPGP